MIVLHFVARTAEDDGKVVSVFEGLMYEKQTVLVHRSNVRFVSESQGRDECVSACVMFTRPSSDMMLKCVCYCTSYTRATAMSVNMLCLLHVYCSV